MSNLEKKKACLFLVTEQQKAKIDERRKQVGLNFSEYLRRAALGLVNQGVVSDTNKVWSNQTYRQLIRVGNNINQIARALNTLLLKGNFLDSAQLREIKETQGEILKLLRELEAKLK
jgi:hypothetical protein